MQGSGRHHGIDKALLRTFKCICALCGASQLGPKELLHWSQSSRLIWMWDIGRQARSRRDRECHQGHGRPGGRCWVGGGDQDRPGAPVAWESHLGRGSEWMEEEEGRKECIRRGRWRPLRCAQSDGLFLLVRLPLAACKSAESQHHCHSLD